MKILSTLVLAGFIAVSVPAYAETKKEPEVKTVCLDVQGRDGKPVMSKDGKPKQNCVKVKVRKKFEGTAIEDAKKK
jgi:hypothetical protein